MIKLLAKIFIKNDAEKDAHVLRTQYGMLCGGFGIFLNIVLFCIKLFAGTVSGSIAITADAFNNLSDAGSSLVTLLGFRLAGQKPDAQHPFGHGRFEYISALIVSFLIIFMGFELGKSSVEKIITPETVDFSIAALVILGVSILVKLYMFFYNTRLGKKLSSDAMKATAFDSLSDTIATSVVLIATVISRFTGLNIDGWCGVAVSLFILYAGIKTAKDTIGSLLGKPADPEFVKNIEKIVMSYPIVLGIHDLIVHDYGPGRLMISLHAEVSELDNINESHDAIDNIERRLSHELGCHAVIHMDPVAYENDDIRALKDKVTALIKSQDERLTLHDFRVVTGPTHTNLVFDVVVPYDVKLSDTEIKQKISPLIKTLNDNYFAVITVDKSYV